MLAAEQARVVAHAIREPRPDQMQHLAGDVSAIGAGEGELLVVEERLEGLQQRLVVHLAGHEQVDDPARGRHVALLRVVVRLEEVDDGRHGEGRVGELQALGERPHFVDDLLIRRAAAVWVGDGGVVGAGDQTAPGGFDICCAAVVGCLVDLQADIVVACLVSVEVVELEFVNGRSLMLSWQ